MPGTLPPAPWASAVPHPISKLQMATAAESLAAGLLFARVLLLSRMSRSDPFLRRRWHLIHISTIGRPAHIKPRPGSSPAPARGVGPGRQLALFLLWQSLRTQKQMNELKMESAWHPDFDATPTPSDVESIVEVLEGCHGEYAAEVAEFFATKHELAGDAGRSWAWAGVAERVRMRTRDRINEKLQDGRL